VSYSFDPQSVTIPEGHYIGGSYVKLPGETIDVLRPSDGQHLGTITEGGEAAVDQAVSVAKAALKSSGWSNMEPRQRGMLLKRWADLIDAHLVELARLESVGSTRPISQTQTGDVFDLSGTIRFFAEYCDKQRGETTATTDGVLSVMRDEPYGVVGAITPWNFPFLTAAWKFAPALAAGNAVVLKVSELTPFSSLRVAELAVEAGLPAGLLNVLNGLGTTGSAIVRHPGIGKISFTGASSTGARIMSEAALHGLKPVSLELGGKSPHLICPDADIDRVSLMVANGVLGNGGQICTAGSRVIVPRQLAEPLIERIAKRFGEVRPGCTWSEDTDFSPIVSRRQAERIDDLVKQSVAAGAIIRVGGGLMDLNLGGAFYTPTILDGLEPGMPGYEHEFFGPVLSIHPFDDIEEGIELCDHPTYGLAASVHTNDLKLAHRAANAIAAGIVWINHHGRAPEFAFPQGGFKQSGFGKDMGREAMDGYTRRKSLWINYA
jgi:aldehyde dehydrogenase (NAD+)